MYGIKKVLIDKSDALYSYCRDTTEAANNLYNATLFRFRQVMTGIYKDTPTENEQSVLDEIKNALPAMGSKYEMPTKGKTFLSYCFLDKLFRVTQNIDFFDKRLSSQCAQNIVKLVVQNMKAYYAAKRTYDTNPSAFTGKPKVPNYHTPGGRTSVNITNQDCIVYPDGIKLPLTKQRCPVGATTGRLKQATIVPYHDVFYLIFVFDDGNAVPALAEEPSRCCAIDLGTENLAAVTNNIGLPSLLFKGGIIKSANQYYNKQMAKLQSEQAKRTGKDFVPTHRSKALLVKRNNVINDVMHKTAKAIVAWCADNGIHAIVVGSNKFWKQNADMLHQNNQNFVQIPFDKFKWMLQYRAERLGIRYIEQEESYTSKASFLHGDFIPVYGQEKGKPEFSGYRVHRGVYKEKGENIVINADLNGSANIGRKAFPVLFTPNKVNVKDAVVIQPHKSDKCNPYGIVAS